MLLNAETILKAQDRKTVTVPCPEWGGDVLIGTMSALDSARIADWLNGQKPIGAQENEESGKVMTCDSPNGKPENLDDEDQADPKYSRSQQTELMLRYLAVCILDPDTLQPAFTADQIEVLGSKNCAPLGRLYKAALEINADSQKVVTELKKNLEETTAGYSGGD